MTDQPKKQESSSEGFIDKLLEFFTGKNNENRIKERKLKSVAKELAQTNGKFFNSKKLQIMPHFPAIIYNIFRNCQSVSKFFDVKNHGVSIREFLFDSMLDQNAKTLKDFLAPENVTEMIKTASEPQKAIENVQKKLKQFIQLFDSKKTLEINVTYNQIVNLSGLVCYDWYFFVRKFDSAISESNFSHKPNFDPLEGKYAVDDLIDINDDLNSVDFTAKFDGVFNYLEEISADKANTEILENVIGQFKKLKDTDVLTKMIKLIRGDPYFKPKTFVSNEKIVNDYLLKIQDATKKAVEESILFLNKEKANRLLMDIFNTTIIVRMKYYAKRLSDFLTSKGVNCVLEYIDPMNYIKAFLLDICKGEVKARIDFLIIKGEWESAASSSRFVGLIDEITKFSEKVVAFDEKCSDEGSYGKDLRRSSVVVKDINGKSSIKKTVDMINEDAKSLIIESINLFVSIGNGLKALIEDYNLKTPVLIVNFHKIKWEYNEDFNSDMIALYKKLANMVVLLKKYIHKG